VRFDSRGGRVALPCVISADVRRDWDDDNHLALPDGDRDFRSS
jgi:hypothetical protein